MSDRPLCAMVEASLRADGCEDPKSEIAGWFTLKIAKVQIRRVGDDFEIDIAGNFDNALLRREVGRALRRALREERQSFKGLPTPTPAQVADVLHLATGICPTRNARTTAAGVIEGWAAEQRFAAVRWALAEHAYAHHGRSELLMPELKYVRDLELLMQPSDE